MKMVLWVIETLLIARKCDYETQSIILLIDEVSGDDGCS
jgi:hypothetical protein